MADKDCTSKDCDAHAFMVDTIREVKQMNLELMRSQQALEHSVIKLSENLQELQRMNARIDTIMLKQEAKEKAQDEEISRQRDFMNKALGLVTFALFIIPIVVTILLK